MTRRVFARHEWPSFEARPIVALSPQATLTFGQCALGLSNSRPLALLWSSTNTAPTVYRVSPKTHSSTTVYRVSQMTTHRRTHTTLITGHEAGVGGVNTFAIGARWHCRVACVNRYVEERSHVFAHGLNIAPGGDIVMEIS